MSLYKPFMCLWVCVCVSGKSVSGKIKFWRIWAKMKWAPPVPDRILVTSCVSAGSAKSRTSPVFRVCVCVCVYAKLPDAHSRVCEPADVSSTQFCGVQPPTQPEEGSTNLPSAGPYRAHSRHAAWRGILGLGNGWLYSTKWEFLVCMCVCVCVCVWIIMVEHGRRGIPFLRKAWRIYRGRRLESTAAFLTLTCWAAVHRRVITSSFPQWHNLYSHPRWCERGFFGGGNEEGKKAFLQPDHTGGWLHSWGKRRMQWENEKPESGASVLHVHRLSTIIVFFLFSGLKKKADFLTRSSICSRVAVSLSRFTSPISFFQSFYLKFLQVAHYQITKKPTKKTTPTIRRGQKCSSRKGHGDAGEVGFD